VKSADSPIYIEQREITFQLVSKERELATHFVIPAIFGFEVWSTSDIKASIESSGFVASGYSCISHI